LALFLAGADGGRISRKRDAASSKFIAGVPVLNYHTAYGGARARKGSAMESLGEFEDAEQEWVVMMGPGATTSQLKAMCSANRNGCNLVGHPSGGLPFIELRGTEKDLERILAGTKNVKYIEPDQEVFMIPDIEAGVEAATWGLNKVGADQRGRSGAGATVFVLDTGVRSSHREFNGRAAGVLDLTIGDPLECAGDLSCAGDVQGHGTHCAGTAAGETYGVAPGAAVKAVKVLSDQGSGSWSWSYYALDWLATSAVRPAVASMSLGGQGTQQAMADAVDAAVNGGVTVVVAGGNSNSDACGFSPAFVPSAITVGSTTSRDARSSFSNYGACTNIWAPGSDILSAGVRSDTATATLSGTSMACPHVSGGAALLLSANPTMKASAVLQELLDNAAMNRISGLRSGDTNALLYVGEGGAPPTPPTEAPPPSNCPGWCSPGFGCLFSSCRNECSFC